MADKNDGEKTEDRTAESVNPKRVPAVVTEKLFDVLDAVEHLAYQVPYAERGGQRANNLITGKT